MSINKSFLRAIGSIKSFSEYMYVKRFCFRLTLYRFHSNQFKNSSELFANCHYQNSLGFQRTLQTKVLFILSFHFILLFVAKIWISLLIKYVLLSQFITSGAPCLLMNRVKRSKHELPMLQSGTETKWFERVFAQVICAIRALKISPFLLLCF